MHALIFLLMTAAAGGTAEVPIVNLPAKGGVNLALAPAGKVDVERMGTVSRVKIDIDKMGLPSALAPVMNAYVVWVISPEGTPENLGELSVVEGRGRLEASTRLDRFGVLVTAEPHYMVDQPSTAVAYTNQEPRDPGIRRTPIRVDIGRYDYSMLQLPPASAAMAGWTIAVEARAALEIARAANAERLAEDEFRLARVAFDTMEAMLARANPAEIVLPAAHDAIRRAARATDAARAAAAGRDAGFKFGDEAVDRPSGTLNAAGRDAVQRVAAAAILWNGPLRILCSKASLTAVKQALSQAGIAGDRLIFVTLP